MKTNKLSKREKMLLVVMVVFAVVVGYTLLLLMPSMDKLTTARATGTELENRRFEMSSTIMSSEDMKTGRDNTRQTAEDRLDAFFEGRDSLSIDRLVTNLVMEHRLSPASLQILSLSESVEKDAQGPLFVSRVALTLKGDFNDFVELLDNVSETLYLSVDSCSYSSGGESYRLELRIYSQGDISYAG